MNQVMVVVGVGLGILLILVAVVALLKGRKGEQGMFEAFGIKVSGSGGSLFLLVGVVLLLSAKRWNDDLARKSELARAVGQYQQTVETLTERARLLEARVPPAELRTLKTQRAPLFVQSRVIVPSAAQVEVQRARLKAGNQ